MFLSPLASPRFSPEAAGAEEPLLPQPQASQNDHVLPDAPQDGPLMAQWRASHAGGTTSAGIPLDDLRHDGHPFGPRSIHRINECQNLSRRLQSEALDAVARLRQPLEPDLAIQLQILQKALAEYDELEGVDRGDSKAKVHVVPLCSNVVVFAKGFGVGGEAASGNENHNNERFAIRLGVLGAEPAVFVDQIYQALAQVTQSIAHDGLGPYVIRAPHVVGLGRAPMRNAYSLALSLAGGALTGTCAEFVFGQPVSAFVASLVGVYISSLIIMGVNQGHGPYVQHRGTAESDWYRQAKATLDLENALDAAAVPVLSADTAQSLTHGEAVLRPEALRQELASRYLELPVTYGDCATAKHIRQAIARIVDPVRRRAEHLVSLLCDEQTFKDDAVLRDLQAYISVVNSDFLLSSRDMPTASFMGQLEVSQSGLGWKRDREAPNCTYDDQEGLAMLFAQWDVDDETFLAEVRNQLITVSRTLLETEGRALRPGTAFSWESVGLPRKVLHLPEKLNTPDGILMGGSMLAVGGATFLVMHVVAKPPLSAPSAFLMGAIYSIAPALAGAFLLTERISAARKDRQRRNVQWLAHLRGAPGVEVLVPPHPA